MRTSTLSVGHLVVNNNLRHPALLGRMATTLDVLSGGRLELGHRERLLRGGASRGRLSLGNHSQERSERLAEGLEIVTRMFAGERTTFAGRYYQVHDLPNCRPPVQTPRPPIHVGGIGVRYTLPLAAKYADVWNVPTYGLGQGPTGRDRSRHRLRAGGPRSRHRARSLEAVLVLAPQTRPASTPPESVAERRYAGPSWGLQDGGFIGPPQAIVDRIGEFVGAGFSYFVFFPLIGAESRRSGCWRRMSCRISPEGSERRTPISNSATLSAVESERSAGLASGEAR